MLNRTFRTLSANLDRLNLRTRSLAAHASVFNVVAPRTLLDDRQMRMDLLREEFGWITGKSPQGYPGIIPPGSGSPPTGCGTPWVACTAGPRVEVVADQPTPACEVVTDPVRRRRRPVRAAARAAAPALRPDASSSWSQAGASRLRASAATSRPSSARAAHRAAGG